jgi:hypothetical protein
VLLERFLPSDADGISGTVAAVNVSYWRVKKTIITLYQMQWWASVHDVVTALQISSYFFR